MRVLVVEDQAKMAQFLKRGLNEVGYAVDLAETGSTAECYAAENEYDLIILDVMLPEVDGFTLAQEIRAIDDHVPIIFLTAKSMKQDKIQGLSIGADDYITKPFSIEELLLKIDIFLRRTKYAVILKPGKPVSIGKYSFDYKNLSLSTEGYTETLTQKEADLLKLLNEHRNQVVKRSFILISIWGKDDYFLGRSLDVFISRLRKYLSLDERIKVENIHGVGFKFRVDD